MGKPVVLVVDDEPLILRAVARVLEHKCDVFKAESVAEARELLDANPAIDVVITDFNMPHVTGAVLLQWLREQRPHVRRILMTATDVTQLAEQKLFQVLLPKPAVREQIVDAVFAPLAPGTS